MAKRDVIKKLQDLTHLAWDEKAVTSGTGGTFLKSRVKSSRGNVYYKLSCYDRYRGIYGHESVNELIASRLLDRLQIPHVPYRLIHARVNVNGESHDTWLSESRDYRSPNERSQSLDTHIELNANHGEFPLDYCLRRGWNQGIYEMMAFDYLIINRDRHGANVEVVVTDGRAELAPLFDHGVSLAFSCYSDTEKIAKFDAMGEYDAQNYIGSRSLAGNLPMIPEGTLKGRFDLDDADWLFHGIDDAIPEALKVKILEIITRRWNHLIELGIAVEG